MTATEPRPPRDSATVLLLRDAQAGLEVFMVRRHLNSDFVGGAYVFPGGGVDAGDADPGLQARLSGIEAHRATQVAPDPVRARAHWVAAVRETFEEANVLLAGPRNEPVAMISEVDRAHWASRRADLLAKRTTFQALMAEGDLTLFGGRIGHFSHWVTPEGSPKRFSTHFFIAVLPENQEPMADDLEVEAGVWIRPTAALAARDRGEMTLILPTVRTLQALADFTSAQAALDACTGRVIVTNLPRIVLVDDKPHVLLPGDAGYEEAGTVPPPAFDPSRL